MAFHVRRQIRDAVAAVLLGLPQVGDRVYPKRLRPLGADHPPTILVYAIEENSDIAAMGAAGGSATLLRNLTVAIEARVSQAEPPDDVLDELAASIEERMAVAPALAAIALEWHLISTKINAQAPGENYAGEVRLEYGVMYRTLENAPTAAL